MCFVWTTFEIASSHTHKNLSIMFYHYNRRFVKRYENWKENKERKRNKCDHLNSYKDSLNIYKKLQHSRALFSFLSLDFSFSFYHKLFRIFFLFKRKWSKRKEKNISKVSLHIRVFHLRRCAVELKREIYDRWNMKEKQFSSFSPPVIFIFICFY